MATPKTGFVKPIILTTDAGVALPVDATNGLTVTLGTKIAGEDLTNDWQNAQVASMKFNEIAVGTLFSSTSVSGSTTETGNWVTVDGFTRWTLFVKLTQAYTCTVYMRPAASTGLVKAAHGYTGTANEVAMISNWRNTGDFGYFADQIRVDMQNTSGSVGTITAMLFMAP